MDTHHHLSSGRRGRTVTRVAGVLCTTLGAFALAAPAAGARVAPQKAFGPSVSLNFETYDTTTDPTTLWAERYAAEVHKDTKGAVTINVYANGELVSQSGAPTALETDSIPMGFAGLNAIAPTSPYTVGVDLPLDLYVTPSYGSALAAAQSIKARGIINGGLSHVNLEDIGTCIQGPSALVSKTPIQNLSEAAGHKMRVATALSGQVVTDMGSTPTIVSIGSTYQALLVNTVDSVSSSAPNDYGYSWYQVAPYLDVLPFNWVPVNMFINTTALSTMNKAEQKVVVSDATSSAPTCDKAEVKYNQTIEHAMEQSGAHVVGFDNAADAKAFENACAQTTVQDETQSPIAAALTKVYKVLNKQYPYNGSPAPFAS